MSRNHTKTLFLPPFTKTKVVTGNFVPDPIQLTFHSFPLHLLEKPQRWKSKTKIIFSDPRERKG